MFIAFRVLHARRTAIVFFSCFTWIPAFSEWHEIRPANRWVPASFSCELYGFVVEEWCKSGKQEWESFSSHEVKTLSYNTTQKSWIFLLNNPAWRANSKVLQIVSFSVCSCCQYNFNDRGQDRKHNISSNINPQHSTQLWEQLQHMWNNQTITIKTLNDKGCLCFLCHLHPV